MKRIALTFDDGPHAGTSDEILDTLKEFDAKSTWFVIGENVLKYPELSQRISDEGHEIGNHTFTHPSLTSLSSQEILEQVSKTDRAIKDTIGGIEASFVRPPMGDYNDYVEEIIDRPLILWSVDSLDWEYKDATKIRNAIVGNVDDGDIVLMHAWVHSTSEVLGDILSSLKDEGFEFQTVSEMLGEKLQNAKVVRSLNHIEYND
ncbi:MAG: polysaccharide deacetylase family protein [Lactobacillaceae bacterium]|jgi:peptidoglycan/xylan/chitin deacetylase (PgdA/CDA1 family)|nr:polysaccharide deacetylase family protein [Lactobacillaceae bacterium]